MKHTLLLSAIALFISSPVHARCPADDMGCTQDNYERKITERIEQGKRDVYDASGPRNKAKAVGSTINDCADCGMKVISDSIEGTSGGTMPR